MLPAPILITNSSSKRFFLRNLNNSISLFTLMTWTFDFFVIRLDMATPLRDPSLTKEERWVKNPLNGNFRYNLAIGYPF